MSNLSNILGGFNANEVEDTNDNSPMPAGEYYVELEKAETKQTANGQGVGLNAQFDVLGAVSDQSQKGRKLFNWFNLEHSNETAQKIGRAEFASLCRAIGNPTPADTDELLGTPLIVKVGIDKKDPEKNRILSYKSVEAASSAPAPAAAPTPAPAPAPAANKKPWE